MSAPGNETMISGEPLNLMIARCLGVVLALTFGRPNEPAKAEAARQKVPAYHQSLPAGKLPSTLDPRQLPDAVTRSVYALAAKIEALLYQQPCYCRCDQSVGHKSLLDCFVTDHAAYCPLCQKSALYVYEQAQQKRTPAQIRQGLAHGEWETVDLGKYSSLR